MIEVEVCEDDLNPFLPIPNKVVATVGPRGVGVGVVWRGKRPVLPPVARDYGCALWD